MSSAPISVYRLIALYKSCSIVVVAVANGTFVVIIINIII